MSAFDTQITVGYYYTRIYITYTTGSQVIYYNNVLIDNNFIVQSHHLTSHRMCVYGKCIKTYLKNQISTGKMCLLVSGGGSA